MDEAGTWHGGRPQPTRLCVKWGPSPLPPKGGGAPSPIFGPFILWPNGYTHQIATWYGPKPQPRRLCVDNNNNNNNNPICKAPECQKTSVALKWIKMSLGMELGLDLGDFVLDGDPVAPSLPQNFRLDG